jgi:hypothetical protein
MIYGRKDLKWKGRELRLATGRLLATIEPDSKYPGMFRVRLPIGRLTDMANITWAKDAAISIALSDLNGFQGQETRSRASPGRLDQPEAPR